jgi:hypothetical protein
MLERECAREWLREQVCVRERERERELHEIGGVPEDMGHETRERGGVPPGLSKFNPFSYETK